MAPKVHGVSPVDDQMIVHVGLSAGEAEPAVGYCYSEGRIKDDPAYERSQGTKVELPPGVSRVHSISGDLGDGLEPSGDEKLDAMLLTSGSDWAPGKNKIRHALEACEPGADPATAIPGLHAQARRFRDRFAPGAKYICIVHIDRTHIHAHVLIENWNPALERRLDWRPSDLSAMQEVEEWGVPGFRSGRRPEEHREPRRPSGKSPSSRDLTREALLADLRSRLEGPGGRDALLASGDLKMKVSTKSGGQLTRPGFSYGGESFRADTISKAGYGDIADMLGLPRQRIAKTDPEASRLPKRHRIGVAGQTLDIDSLMVAKRLELREHLRSKRIGELERSTPPRLTFDRFDSSGRWHRDPSLSFDRIKMHCRGLRQAGFDDLADLIVPPPMPLGPSVERQESPKRKEPPKHGPSAPPPSPAPSSPRSPKPSAPGGMGAALSNVTGAVSNAKIMAEAVTDPAAAGRHIAENTVEHVATKAAAALIGHPAAAILAGGIRAASSGREDAATETAKAVATSGVKLGVAALVPGGTAAVAIVDAGQAVASLVAPPAPPPVEPAPDDSLQAMTRAEDPAPEEPAPPKKKANYAALAQLGRAMNLHSQQPPKPSAPDHPRQHEPQL